MIPFLHIWRLTVPTFGLMVASAMLAAYFLLRAEIARRGLAPDRNAASSLAELFIAVPSLAGIVGAKLYHELQSPAEFFAHPFRQLVSPYGFAWFGGLLAGFGAFVWLAASHKIPLLEIVDAGSPAAALGYGVGRIGCFLSGDGDYGIPTSLPWGMSFPNGLVPTDQRVHPTPLYEFVAACAIAWWLWRLGAKQIAALKQNATANHAAAKTASKSGIARGAGPATEKLKVPQGTLRPSNFPAGAIFSAYLVLTGAERFLIEFIRINPRSFLGMSNAQAASVLSMIAGAALWWRLRHKPIETPSTSTR
jgi:phosphatidylglycerol:prolipoprotein diacylglycerol transferase